MVRRDAPPSPRCTHGACTCTAGATRVLPCESGPTMIFVAVGVWIGCGRGHATIGTWVVGVVGVPGCVLAGGDRPTRRPIGLTTLSFRRTWWRVLHVDAVMYRIGFAPSNEPVVVAVGAKWRACGTCAPEKTVNGFLISCVTCGCVGATCVCFPCPINATLICGSLVESCAVTYSQLPRPPGTGPVMVAMCQIARISVVPTGCIGGRCLPCQQPHPPPLTSVAMMSTVYPRCMACESAGLV